MAGHTQVPAATSPTMSTIRETADFTLLPCYLIVCKTNFPTGPWPSQVPVLITEGAARDPRAQELLYFHLAAHITLTRSRCGPSANAWTRYATAFGRRLVQRSNSPDCRCSKS